MKKVGPVIAVAAAGLCAMRYPQLKEHPYVLAVLGFLAIVLWLGWMLFVNPLGKKIK